MLNIAARRFSDVVIVAAKRTPIGSFMGALKDQHAASLGTVAIKAALDQSGLDPGTVDEVFLGNVLQAGGKQAPTRQAALHAGLPEKVECTTINKVCASGLKSAIFGAQTIKLGDNNVVVAGGFENMSQAPFYLLKQRAGVQLGDAPCVDAIMYDGLTCAFDKTAMGVNSEHTIDKNEITREMQDNYAIESYRRATDAWDRGYFDSEIAPVTIKNKKGDIEFTKDEDYTKVKLDKIPQLKSVFKKDGSITAANASMINDGASCVILMSADKARDMNIKPLAKIIAYGDGACNPTHFGEAPYFAI